MITIVSGTNRKNSISIKVATQYQEILHAFDVKSSIIDLEKLPSDFITSALYENQGSNQEFNPILKQVKETQKFVFITPEYNGSFPGILKTFIDAFDFPSTLQGKKCALVGLSAGIQGSVLAMSHLTDIFNFLGMHVFANKPKLIQINDKIKDGKIMDPFDINQLEEQARTFIQF